MLASQEGLFCMELLSSFIS